MDSLPELDPRRADVQEISQAVDQATSLTRQLLAFGRKQPLEPRVVSLAEVGRGMEKMVRRLIGEDIELVGRIAPGSYVSLCVSDTGSRPAYARCP